MPTYRFAHPTGSVEDREFPNDQEATQHALLTDDKLQSYQFKLIDDVWHREADTPEGWAVSEWTPEIKPEYVPRENGHCDDCDCFDCRNPEPTPAVLRALARMW